jgi:chromosome segregation ATPase
METQEKDQLRQEIEEIKQMNLQNEEIEQLRIERDEYFNQIQVANGRNHGLKRENSDLKTAVKDLTVIAASKEDHIEALQAERDNFARKAAELCIQQENMHSGSSTGLGFEFSLQELQQATQNFSESFKIGGGGFGSVYKGSLRQTTVAIKMLHTQSLQGISQFQQEVILYMKLEIMVQREQEYNLSAAGYFLL